VLSRISATEVGIFLGLVVFIGGLFWLLAEMKKQEALRARLELVLDGHRSARRERGDLPVLRDLIRSTGLFRKACQLIDLKLERVNEYRPRWYIILIGALIIARLASGMAADILHEGVALPVFLGVFLGGARLCFTLLNQRRRAKLFVQFPDALGQITRSVRVGMPVVEAIRNVAQEAPEPTLTEFRAIADRLTVGIPLDQALAETAHRTGLPEYSFFATALALQARTGGGIAETLDNLADVIRKRVALRARGYALAAEARTSASILAAIPIVTTAILLVLNPAYALVLFTTPDGKLALGMAIAMMVTGVIVMQIIIRKSLS
jgi:tight adherence protein B